MHFYGFNSNVYIFYTSIQNSRKMTITTNPTTATNAPAVRSAPVSLPASPGGSRARVAQAAREVGTQVQINERTINRFGAVSNVGARAGSSFTIVIDNTATAEKTYILGDPFGVIEAAIGVSYLKTYSVPGSSAAAWKASTQNGYALDGLSYQVDDAAQFSNSLRIVEAQTDGSFASVPINLALAALPTFQNDKLLVFQFANDVVLDSRRAMTLTVNAQTKVTLNFTVAAFSF